MSDTVDTTENPINAISDAHEADIYLLSGAIDREAAEKLRNYADNQHYRENAILILATHGGDADAAYIIARSLKRNYKQFFLYVFGLCKSAGTIIALGADKIVMSSSAELGPLDVQLLKEDDLGGRNSGLDILNAMEVLSAQTYKCFLNNLLRIKQSTGGTITTKTASEIATSLSVGLFAPVSGQLDPMRIGETQRAILIAKEYGERLGASSETVSRLIFDYPTHGFVIDRKEAKELFAKVVDTDYRDEELALLLAQILEEDRGINCVKYPDREGVLIPFSLKPEGSKEDRNDTNEDTPTSENGTKVEKSDDEHAGKQKIQRSSRNGSKGAKRNNTRTKKES